ncbi:hypothetical protein F7725_027040 [Dissostichus mawsoni]|uniref:C2H2-type domain-containing protein n=1 Tax=Dissostichus mawsoni TaxID=36200 RepID=A0A7J5X8R8_DISMA|nr:hypothetical protein F7725_027040 [Dissostichus mawsoni]
MHCSATKMYSGSSVLQPPESGMGGNKRIPCPLHGCKRVYTDPAALESHIKDHEIAAQSLPGKVMLCSTVGCSGSFPNMQKLIEHMRHHHKPNIFFLRSYRGLLTHLHTCSKVMRGKAKPTEPNMAPMEVDQKPPWLEAASAPSQILNPDPSFPAAVKPGPDGPPLLGPPSWSCSSRILWEHTKGRYTCVQCGHMVISRKEMTQHISTKHSRNKAAEDTGSAATNT